ncbi:MAG: enoyl-CoA hydratase/isomerase family protein [Myxococcales bacterium]|nr:enoyl-CoA hydratase/isomerase family protein [Myxococcales bacterium]TDJ07750.1 MAG: enoyl-CoA hydratase [Deltaproteobacteria bacterium]
MSFETLLYETRDGVAYITLNREAAANAINLQMGRDLMLAALRCDEDAGVRAVLIRAKGKIFCAGGDLGSFSSAGEGMPRLLKELTTYLHAAISRFARMRAPVVAAVHGSAAGAGFSLACASDLLVCAESAKFTLAYTRVGLTPDGSSTYYLPRLIGTRRALELMLTNRVLSSQEALAWGLVNRVVADDQLAQESESLARQLATGPTLAFGGVKQLLLSSANESLETQMEHEARAIADAARSSDAREGIEAFFAKRRAKFNGV